MTKEEEEKISERFRINLRNAIHELTAAIEAIDDVDLGYSEKEHYAHSCISEALKDMKKAVLYVRKRL